jgi:hypothetical protein
MFMRHTGSITVAGDTLVYHPMLSLIKVVQLPDLTKCLALAFGHRFAIHKYWQRNSLRFNFRAKGVRVGERVPETIGVVI